MLKDSLGEELGGSMYEALGSTASAENKKES
jgi:hypothetical protein